MLNVHLFFLKLTGCMIAEKASGHDVPVSIEPFSDAIMSDRPHAEVYVEFGKHDGIVGRSDLHCWTVDAGKSVLAGWLYELDTIAVSVIRQIRTVAPCLASPLAKQHKTFQDREFYVFEGGQSQTGKLG
jgi:hypothetical protein